MAKSFTLNQKKKNADFLEKVANGSHEKAFKGRSLYYDAWLRFKKNKVAMISLVVLFLIVLAVIVLPWFSPYTYAHQNLLQVYQAPSSEHWFGTDSLGRDVFTRVMVGGRITLEIGFVATLVSVVIGTLVGATAGFFGGKIDNILMRIVDVLYGLPFMFFAILLVTLFGRNFILVFIAIGAVSWLDMARVVRGQTLGLKNKEFIEAAYVCGVKESTIITRHIVRNLIGIIAVYITLTVPVVIMTAAFLSFLGLGVQPPMTDWGGLISDGVQVIAFNYWWLLVIPSIFLTVTLLCFNFVGNGLRDALDPREHR
ncbi:ABC transporter permease [Fangia hongkongensis]|uniref:ABC transporter permease n=1 Tax=Fangia hongkongensis TaxID=270495 RepID=UPI00035DF5FB|nr:ABC transporter permease subunit [Fangia hongkongensis]MBK2125305.1 ABC transporter permease subunit [Fangia hongkongensis]